MIDGDWKGKQLNQLMREEDQENIEEEKERETGSNWNVIEYYASESTQKMIHFLPFSGN